MGNATKFDDTLTLWPNFQRTLWYDASNSDENGHQFYLKLLQWGGKRAHGDEGYLRYVATEQIYLRRTASTVWEICMSEQDPNKLAAHLATFATTI